jgi:hypothetical protein
MANLSKLTTAQLQAKLAVAEGDIKKEIEALLAKRNIKSAKKAEPKKTAAAASDDDLIGDAPKKPAKKPAEEKKAKLKKAKVGMIASFHSRHGQQLIKGEIVRISLGKKDGKTYVAVKHKNKIYQKQEGALLSVE